MSHSPSPLVSSGAAPLYRRHRFFLSDDVIYLDGNSLGPLPRSVPDRIDAAVRAEWGASLVKGWNEAGWFALPAKVARRIEPLIGAEPETVSVGDSTSVNLFKVLSAALTLAGPRRRILSDAGNFPSDLYIADGLTRLVADGFHVTALPSEDVEAAIGDDVAVVMLTEVDYRTGRRRDMKAVTEAAHAVGAIIIWDLAHSAGAFPVRLAACGADFAVGCGYKFLNGGPGAPAFLYVAPRHADAFFPAIAGWMGHDDPFLFEPTYRAGQGIRKMQAGTPPILSLTALDEALTLYDDIDLTQLQAVSQNLCDLFIDAVETRCPDLVLASPRVAAERGSQVSFRHPEGYAVMRALIDRNVIGDFRAPDILRFGITPLYTNENDLRRAAEVLQEVLDDRLWDRDAYRVRAAVT